MERDVPENDHIPEEPVTEMTGDTLITHYQSVEGTPAGEPSNEPVPIFPSGRVPEGNDDA